MTNLNNLTVAQLRQVVAIKEQIERLQEELDAIAGGESVAARSPAPEEAAPAGRKKRRMSRKAKAAIALAQKARWARLKGNTSVEAAPVEKKKRKVSRAVRAKLAAAAKARWAKRKAEGKTRL